jgi:hypothetical protein
LRKNINEILFDINKKESTNNFQIQIQSLQPDAMDVGENLEEALNFLSFHQELCSKLKVF